MTFKLFATLGIAYLVALIIDGVVSMTIWNRGPGMPEFVSFVLLLLIFCGGILWGVWHE